MYYSMIANPFTDRGLLDDPSLPEGVSFIRGAWLQWRPERPLVFRSNCDASHLPRPFMGRAIPVWSKDLLDAFGAACVDNVQAFPAVVTDRGGDQQWPGYFAINVLGLVAAADLRRSRFEKIGEYPSGLPLVEFDELVIDASRVQDLCFFRLAESPLHLIVHERVLDNLRKVAPPGGWGISSAKLKQSG